LARKIASLQDTKVQRTFEDFQNEQNNIPVYKKEFQDVMTAYDAAFKNPCGTTSNCDETASILTQNCTCYTDDQVKKFLTLFYQNLPLRSQITEFFFENVANHYKDEIFPPGILDDYHGISDISGKIYNHVYNNNGIIDSAQISTWLTELETYMQKLGSDFTKTVNTSPYIP